MGWAVGWTGQRWVGYGVPSLCDCGCGEKIDRGIAHVCGDMHGGGERGCGRYISESHQSSALFSVETGDLIPDDDPRWKLEDFDPDDESKYEWAIVCPRCAAGEPAYDPTPDLDEWVIHQLIDPTWQQWRDEQQQNELSSTRLENLIIIRRHAILEALRVDRARAEKAEEELLEYQILAEQKRHLVQISDRGWTIAHPVRERLDLESLFDCRITPRYEPLVPKGRYWLNDDGTLGEQILTG